MLCKTPISLQGGFYATTSSHLIGGTQSTHSLSQAEFASLNLHLEESELIDDFVGEPPISGPTAQSRTYKYYVGDLV